MSAGHVRQRSPGSWEVRYRADGRTHTATVRGTKRDAQQALRNALATVDQGTHVDPSKATVAEWITARVALWPTSARTKEHYSELAALIAHGLGALPVQRLTTVDVERWHAALRARKLAATTIRHAHALLVRALADGVRHSLLPRNVAREQALPKAAERREVQIVAADQIGPLLSKLAGDPWHAPVVLALYSGLRRGEQLALRWCNVDLDGAKLRVLEALDETKANGVAFKLPKTASGRRAISLPTVVVETLREHRQQQLELRMALGLGRLPDDALVFPGDDGDAMSPRWFSMRWRRKAAKLGRKGVTWHALRHTHASMLISAGVPITTVQARLGHSDPSTTLRVYAHLFEKDDSAAAAAIDRALGQ